MTTSPGTTILDETSPGIGRIWIVDRGPDYTIGRYAVYKIMLMANGRNRTSRSCYFQRPAAIAYARRWLAKRREVLHRTEGFACSADETAMSMTANPS